MSSPVDTTPEHEPTRNETPEQQLAQLRAARERIRDLEALLAQPEADASLSAEARLEQLRLLVGNLQELILVVDPGRRITDVAGNCMGLIGYSTFELSSPGVDLDVVQLFDERDRSAIERQFTEAGLRPQGSSTAARILDRAGETRWVECTLVPLYSETEHELAGLQVILRDISERIHSEQMVHSLNEASAAVQKASLSLEEVLEVVTGRLRALDLNSAVGLMDPESGHVHWAKLRGDSRCIQAMEKLSAAAPDLSLRRVPEAWRRLEKDEAVVFGFDQAVMAQPDIPLDVRRQIAQLLGPTMLVVSPLRAEAHLLGYLAVASTWLSEESIPAIQAYANQTAIAIHNSRLVGLLADSETQYRAIFESARDGLLVMDVEGRIVAASETTCALFGIAHDAILGLPVDALLSLDIDEISSCCQEGVYGGESQPIVAQAFPHNRDPLPVELRGSRVSYGDHVRLMVLITDISERIQAQEALIQSERLSALGQMAGGIAHDFNNILQSILGYAETAQADAASAPDRLMDDLSQIQAGARDAADAVSRLQSLYRNRDDRSDFTPVQLDEIIAEALALNRPRWKDIPQLQGITYHIDTQLHEPEPVLGNPSELRRVFSNLLINAIDAMPEGGRLTFESGQEGSFSRITVRDTGIGMSPEVQKRVFEPFFTTKRSSGLGLTVCANIVKRHNGTLSIESESGKGTAVSVRMPAYRQAAATTPREPSDLAAATPVRPLSVLVIDDEPHVRGVLGRILERHGHTAKITTNGAEGLAALAEQPYDLLICDLGMPEMPGSVVMPRAHDLRPEMPIILATGWGDSVTPDQLREMCASALLAKPFGQEDVRRAISEALEAGPVA